MENITIVFNEDTVTIELKYGQVDMSGNCIYIQNIMEVNHRCLVQREDACFRVVN